MTRHVKKSIFNDGKSPLNFNLKQKHAISHEIPIFVENRVFGFNLKFNGVFASSKVN